MFGRRPARWYTKCARRRVGSMIIAKVGDHSPGTRRSGNGRDGRVPPTFTGSDVCRDRRRVNNVGQERYNGGVNVTPMSEIRGHRARRDIRASRANCITQDIRCQFRAMVGNVPKKDDEVGMVANGTSWISRRGCRHGTRVYFSLLLRMRTGARRSERKGPARVGGTNGSVYGQPIVNDRVFTQNGRSAIIRSPRGEFLRVMWSNCVGQIRFMVKASARPIMKSSRGNGERRNWYGFANK